MKVDLDKHFDGIIRMVSLSAPSEMRDVYWYKHSPYKLKNPGELRFNVILPRKACTVINKKYLYSKPTQVGK